MKHFMEPHQMISVMMLLIRSTQYPGPMDRPKDLSVAERVKIVNSWLKLETVPLKL